VAELVDALGSGSSVGSHVGVRVPSSAPFFYFKFKALHVLTPQKLGQWVGSELYSLLGHLRNEKGGALTNSRPFFIYRENRTVQLFVGGS
jgi:hypothetical protein